MTKYKVGDKPTVKHGLSMGWVNGLWINQSMVECAGKKVEIREAWVDKNGDRYYMKTNEELWCWSNDCFEPIEPEYEPTRSMKEPELQKTIGETNPMTRASILAEAAKIVTTDREQQYGSPEDNFGLAARYWTILFDKHISAHGVAMAMTLLKMARIQSGQVKPDNYVDGCGYLACGAEIAGKGAK